MIAACADELRYGDSFSLEFGGVEAIDKVVLMRPEVVTHVTNTDQRLLELTIESQANGRLQVSGPPSRAHMPAGYCLLFLLTAGGVPSVGKFVRLS